MSCAPWADGHCWLLGKKGLRQDPHGRTLCLKPALRSLLGFLPHPLSYLAPLAVKHRFLLNDVSDIYQIFM